MGNFLNYTDIPIYANFTGENGPINTSSAENFFAATSASLTIDPNLVENRYVNINQDKNDFSHNGPLEGKFNFTFYPLVETINNYNLYINKNNQLAFFDLTGDFATGHNIKLSNLLLKKCFLESYSLKIEPFKPISISSNFIVYDMSSSIGDQIVENKIQFSGSKSKNPSYEALHGTTSKLIDNNKYGEVKSSINIDVRSTRVPVYTLGSKYPEELILKSVERTISITSNNIKEIVDITGRHVGNTPLYLMPYALLFNPQVTPNDQYSVLKFDISGRITSQQISVDQNDNMKGTIVIKEIIL